MSDVHTLTAFENALNDLRSKALQMGNDVSEMVESCVEIFLGRDSDASKDTIQADLAIDRQKDALIAATMQIIARHQPVAADLRLVLAVEHVASDLERTADHAKNIAKRTLSLSGEGGFDPEIRDQIVRLHQAVSKMLKDAMQAFECGDTIVAGEVSRRDHIPDGIYDDLFHAVIARIQTDSSDAASDIQALFVAKSLERIGDHATNIADEACFLARGVLPSATRVV